jgi:Domain of unknown function (DUF3244)
MKKIFLGVLFLGLGVFSNPTFAQSLLAEKNTDSAVAKAVSIEGLQENEGENWAVYADESNRKFFVDLEKLHIYLDKITVINDKNEAVYSDNLWNLPTNAIYELDLSEFPKGSYRLEFKTLTNDNFYKNFEIK